MFTTITALVDSAVPPGLIPTHGFHAEMVPSRVQKRNTAALPGARKKPVGLALAIMPVGVPAGKVLLVGSAFENVDHKRRLHACSVVQRAESRGGIGDPPLPAEVRGIPQALEGRSRCWAQLQRCWQRGWSPYTAARSLHPSGTEVAQTDGKVSSCHGVSAEPLNAFHACGSSAGEVSSSKTTWLRGIPTLAMSLFPGVTALSFFCLP